MILQRLKIELRDRDLMVAELRSQLAAQRVSAFVEHFDTPAIKVTLKIIFFLTPCICKSCEILPIFLSLFLPVYPFKWGTTVCLLTICFICEPSNIPSKFLQNFPMNNFFLNLSMKHIKHFPKRIVTFASRFL